MHASTVICMSSLQVREVPEDVARVLKQRAARAGQSLSEYVLGELRQIAARPTIEELTERIAWRGRVDVSIPAAEILIQARSER